jgi:hypothetical protein
MAVVLNVTLFQDVTPCSFVDGCQRFGGTYCLNFKVE